MPSFRQRESDAFQKPFKPDDPGIFEERFPTETRGNGLLVPSNRRTGAAQGQGSFKRRAYCQQCGFPGLDMARDDHTGGSLDGDGGVSISTSDVNYTISSGDTLTESVGDSTISRGSGCPHCGSKNGAKERLEDVEQIEPVPMIGF